MRLLRRLFVVAMLAGTIGCAVHSARPLPAPSDPTALFAEVREREQRIVSMRARFTAVTYVAGEQRRADGVLLVKKPDRFRLRLMLPFGPTIFDYVNWGEHTQLTLPLQGNGGAAPSAGLGSFTRDDFGEAFLRGSYAFPGECGASRDAGGVTIACRDRGGALLRRLQLDAATGNIREETSFENGAPRLVLRYADFRQLDAVEMPFRIAMVYPARDTSVEISISRYELNLQLADTLFQPSRPWGS